MANDWISFVKQVWLQNPGMSYKEAMVLASQIKKGTVKPMTKKKGKK